MPVALGARILAKYQGGQQEFPGVVAACYNDGTYDIHYDDGDAEERVDYSLIRKIPVPNPKKPQESSNHGKHGSGTDTSDLAQENKTLRAQIKQMIALSEEDDAETEKLVQSMNASLNEARQMNRNKDTEMERMQKALAEARRASKAQSSSSSKHNQQIDELKAQVRKALEAEASAKRAHQSTKSEYKQVAEERREATEATIATLTQQVTELRQMHSAQQQHLSQTVRESEAKLRASSEKERLASLDRQRDAQAKADLSKALKEAKERATQWEQKHMEVQALSDQAYEIMKDELMQKDSQLATMHSEMARLTRESADAAMTRTTSIRNNSASSPSSAPSSSSSSSVASSEATSSCSSSGDNGGGGDTAKNQDVNTAALIEQLQGERDRARQLVQQLRGQNAELSVAQERAVSAAARIEEQAATESEAQHKELSDSERKRMAAETEVAALEERLRCIQQQQEERKAAEGGGASETREANRENAAAAGFSPMDELEREVRTWKRKHRELSDLSDEAYAIMSEQLKEKDTALADVQKRLKELQQQQGAFAENNSKVDVAFKASSPLTDSTNTDANTKNELSSSLEKLQQKWLDKESSFKPVVNSDASPTPQSEDGAGSNGDVTSGRSSPAVQIQAQAARLKVLEVEVAAATSREGDLREELVHARAEIRRLQGLLEAFSENGGVGGNGSEGSGEGAADGARRPSLEEVKGHMRRLSALLMEGDETHLGEYEKWEAALVDHPEYQAETLAELESFEKKHAARNAASLVATRRFLPPNIWTTTFKDFKRAAFHLPEKLVKHLWENKILWWTRLHPRYIAKIHIADLRSKYIIKHLDLVELRAIFACLPKVFENDTTGEKATWRENTIEAIKALLDEDERTKGGLPNKNKLRNRLYFKGGPLKGPFDADEPPEAPDAHLAPGGASTVQSEAFAPTPQFQSVGRLDDNILLRQRRANIIGGGEGGDYKEIKRQVPQFTEIHSLTENPEMRRRREAFLAEELMKERQRSNPLLNALDLSDATKSKSGSPNGKFRNLTTLIKHDASLVQQKGGELRALFSLHQGEDDRYVGGYENNDYGVSIGTTPHEQARRFLTQWEADQDALRNALASREERTRHDFQSAPDMDEKYAAWELDLAKAREQKRQQEEKQERAYAQAQARAARNHSSRGETKTIKGDNRGVGGAPFVAKARPWAAARRTIVPSGGRAVFNGETRDKVGSAPIKTTDRMAHLVDKYRM